MSDGKLLFEREFEFESGDYTWESLEVRLAGDIWEVRWYAAGPGGRDQASGTWTVEAESGRELLAALLDTYGSSIDIDAEWPQAGDGGGE